MRYDIVGWVAGERDHYLRTWGARRAWGVAEALIRQYQERGDEDFEVGIFRTRNDQLLALFSSQRAGWMDLDV